MLVAAPNVRKRSSARGFTLIELVTVVALLGLLASLAAPGMRSLIQAQRLRSASYDLTADLILARSEALKRGTDVELVPTGGDWKSGWTVQVASPVVQLAQHGALGNGIAASSDPVGNVTFNASGRVTSSAAMVSFSLSNEIGGIRCVRLDLSGRPKSIPTSC